MRAPAFRSFLRHSLAAAGMLLAAAASGQTVVDLTAQASSLTMPDGTVVPMWGLSCQDAGTLGAGPGGSACGLASAPSTVSSSHWAPPVIMVPTGNSLTINLTNALSFAAGTGTSRIPTSLTIVGQLGGGLGDVAQRTTTPSPVHAPLGVTWSTVNTPGGANPTFTPPPQAPRVQSFGTEVAAGAPASTALTWSSLNPGTYLLESGTHPSIQGPMGLYGIVVVTQAAGAGAAGTAYPGVRYDAEVPVLLSEIDPVQNAAVDQAVRTQGFSETAVWSGQPGGCGNPASANAGNCYPPAVNYTPLYYLFNGVAFSRSNASASLFNTLPATIPAPPPSGSATGSVLVRLVNAGLRMHVPALVGTQTGSAAPGATAPGGFTLVAEDGNPVPGAPRVQTEVFMAAGKTYDVMLNASAAGSGAVPIYDRELSLSGNAVQRDAGMLAYLSIPAAGAAGGGVPVVPSFTSASANADSYAAVLPCPATASACAQVAVSDPAKGVLANDTNVYGVQVVTAPGQGTLVLNANGTFVYQPAPGWSGSDSFVYCGNGTRSGPACATVTLSAASVEAASGITVANASFGSNVATFISVAPPGLLAGAVDSAGHPLSVAMGTLSALAPANGTTGSGTLRVDANGAFTASVTGAGTYTFSFQAVNSQGTLSSNVGTATLTFAAGSGLAVTVVDGATQQPLAGQDYRWIIEEDTTFFVDPKCAQNPPPSGCPGAASGVVPTFGTNFHTSHLPFVAQGCTGPLSCEGGQTVYDPASGTHVAAVCDLGNGACRPDTTGAGRTVVLPGAVQLDPTKRYYLSVLPGDAAAPFIAGCTADPSGGSCVGHGMGGASIAAGQTSVSVLSQASPYQPGKLSVMVFEDDFPLNGEQDSGGGVDVLAPNEPGLGNFNIQLWDAMGGNGDFTGQMTYDMFNQPLTNSLDGTVDPVTGLDACAITRQGAAAAASGGTDGAGISGMIVTCPKYEGDGTQQILSPLAGQVVINNLMQGRFEVIATPGADRIARGEQWLQTNTLDGQKAHDTFIRIGEPTYFQEFGPAGYHATIGFANPAIINARRPGVCAGTDPFLTIPGGQCTNTIIGKVTTERMSRTPDERLYSSGSHDSFYWTTCYVSFGDPDGEDFAFTTCDDKGNFTLAGLPPGTWRVTVFDQWNDMLVDGLSTPVAINGPSQTVDMGDIATNQWQVNVYTRTFIDSNQDGVSQSGEDGVPLVPVAVRYRDGSLANGLTTDFTGTANFNETFPLFNWYVVETDTTRYKNTGTHVVYDVGGPADGTTACGVSGYPPCGASVIGKYMANTAETVSLPVDLRVPGSVYCGNADCTGYSIQGGPGTSAPPSNCTMTGGVISCSGSLLSSGRIDTPWLGGTEAWQSFSGQNNFLEFGKEPYVPGENGGIKGHVVYASTRPFDDPQMLVQTQWEPLVPHVTLNLYQEGTAADGTQTLTLVDTTQTSSWDDWAQGFRRNADGTPVMSTAGKGAVPYMNCPGQWNTDLFFFTLYNQPDYLDLYNNVVHGSAPAATPLAYNSQFKCYDGMHNWNQLQPAPYDGMYRFPSVTATDPVTGKPTATGTHCTICAPNTAVAPTDLYYGVPMLPAGKYVVEVVVPPGFELVKEEDKNILIGDNYIAPVSQQFGGLGDVFIMPDQASVASAYNANNAQNATTSLGAQPNNGIVPGFVPEPTWPCVGEARVVPDYISLFPRSHQVSPFAGATRRLCDRKEVTLGDQTGAIAKFYVYTSTHVASKFTGVITDDFTSEFDPFSPAFGEKFSPPNMPIAFRDWTGAEISRVYSDQWGAFNGVTYSSWEVNPPNPTGYSPTMMVTCMNDPGPVPGANGTAVRDPLFNPGYSQFCYELPFMPGWTTYMDTPVVPTSAFAGAGYNNVDCAYPAATPAISEVDGDGVGPWVSAAGKTLTLHALGDQLVNNYGYSGPSATAAPFNQKTVTRHYGFGDRCSVPTPGSATCNAFSSVRIGGVIAPIQSWSDTTITVTVPGGVANCAVQQQAQYGGSTAQCGQLVITAGSGQRSVDTVTVTIGGKAPIVLTNSKPLTPSSPGAIQQAIDAALPGDLIMIPPGTYNEMVLMWKPVRLQGVGAASVTLNANTQPAGKLDPWRHQVNCLFGLALNGTPYSSSNPYDPTGALSCPGTGWKAFAGAPQSPQVDRLPLEGIVGWDTTTNGNLAQMLQEPTLMGAYEGAAITVLSKGVNSHGQAGYYGSGSEASFPTGTTLLTGNPASCGSGTSGTRGYVANPFPSNFQCNPSRIDGLSITDSSQGGGGIFVHAWGHNLEIANNRIYNNIGTLSGGINVGQGESPDGYLALSADNSDPGSCQSSNTANVQLPYCFDLNVNVHNNAVMMNTSIGDELFSGTPAGAGGVSFCTGADYYRFTSNWVCGNLSTGDGGGFSHIGFIYNGDVENNTVIFNQSTNPTIATNGGGILVMGAAPDGYSAAGVECGGTIADADCAPGLPDGTGPNLKINANLVLGNGAESGSGGGLRLQSVNGTEVSFFPGTPGRWNSVSVTNNIITNNVAGWDGAGISLQDALVVDIINNTVVSNDTTASSGVLFNTIGAPLASAPAPGQTYNGTSSQPQPAGIVTMTNSSNLTATFAGLSIICPAGHYAGSTATNGTCTRISYPNLVNDLFWQNRSFFIGVGGLSNLYQQNVVALFNAVSGTAAATQPALPAVTANGNGAVVTGGTGACTPGATYWDIGVRGDTGPGQHDSGYTLTPTWSVLTNSSESQPGSNNLNSNPTVVQQYCNGARVPPEFGGTGYQVPPGISDATVPNPIFSLSPNATVDEGNNWINISWGPLAQTHPVTGATLGNYALATGSPAINYIPASSAAGRQAPATDFFGNPRPAPGSTRIDVGAVEFQGTEVPPALTGITPSSGARGQAVQVTLTGTNLQSVTGVSVSGAGVTVSNVTTVNSTTVTAVFTISATASLTGRNVAVTGGAGTSGNVTFTVVGPTLVSVAPASAVRGTAVPVTFTGTDLGAATGVNATGSGVAVTGVTPMNATTVTATVTVSNTAATGTHNVSVVTADGTTNALPFTVVGPTLTGISPATGAHNTTVAVTLTGANLASASGITVSGGGVTVSSFTAVNATTVKANFVIANGATRSARNVSVTTGIGTTNAMTFTVN